MKPDALDIITDHALIRYIERVNGLDLEAVRNTIAALPGLAEACALGASNFSVAGVTYVIRGKRVTTVMPGESASARMRHTAKFQGKSVRMRGPQY